MVLDNQLRSHVVSALSVLSQFSTCHRVHVILLVPVEYRAGTLQHGVVRRGIFARYRILLIDTHVRHLLHGDVEQTVRVTMVIGIGKREVGTYADTFTYIIVESHTGRETLQFLLDHRTGLIIETCTDTEQCLLTTTFYGNIVVLTETPLGNSLTPVGIVVILLVFRERRVVVQLRYIRCSIALLRVEVRLLQQHGVVVTIQELISLWLVCTSQLQ